MNELLELIGRERALDTVNQALYTFVQQLRAPVVGALHVTCADESEWECIDSFQRTFVEPLLPALKFARKAPFRLSNLGGRYEWGAVAVAEHHFATPESREAFKVLLVKINSHVAAQGTGSGAIYGRMRRYETESAACGALHTLLAGGDRPFLADLQETFATDELDRLALLRDERRINPAHRGLLVALANARLQSRRAARDIRNHTPAGPTLYIIASCCTLNRPEEDSELLCGIHIADCRTPERRAEYHGLGDDPSRYIVRYEAGRLRVTEHD